MWAVAIILTAIADSNILGEMGKRTKKMNYLVHLFSSFLEPNNPNPCIFLKQCQAASTFDNVRMLVSVLVCGWVCSMEGTVFSPVAVLFHH